LCLEFQDKPADALPSYRKAVALAPKIAAYQRNLAGILIELKNYLEAETVAQTAVQLDATSSRAFNLLGVAQYEQNKYDASIPNYQKAIELSQSKPQAVYFRNIGLAYEAVKNYPKAREAYQRAFDLGSPSYKTTVQGDLDRIKGK
jgi:tetratricopeptide (TPR) repeat protein